MIFTLFPTIIFSIVEMFLLKKKYKVNVMLGKFGTLIVIIVLLLTFYFVISLGAKTKINSPAYPKISKYLVGVRILIIFIATVSLILWFIL